jgi:FkbM family methyltransferase
MLGYAVEGPDHWWLSLRLAWVRGKVWGKAPGSTVRCANYTVRIRNGPYYYLLYKDIFLRRIYHFNARQPDPLILDCGSNIGMSIFYFKSLYPKARIIAFDPDPVIFPYLQQNMADNGLTDVRLVHAALASREKTATLYSDGVCGSALEDYLSTGIPEGWRRWKVPCHRLRDYLTDPVDFLKMNIEGAEYDVLADSADYLQMVREMVVEYHHLPGLPRTLHKILTLLDEQGFEYMVNDFDSETNGAVQPPFHLAPETRYYLLIYAKRVA